MKSPQVFRSEMLIFQVRAVNAALLYVRMKMAPVAAFDAEEAQASNCVCKWSWCRRSRTNDCERQFGSPFVIRVERDDPISGFGQHQRRCEFSSCRARLRI